MEKQWFESEEFWINYAPVMFDETRWAEAPAVAQSVLDMHCAGSGKALSYEKLSVLDAGCGMGRISVELALLGADVTGVDIIEAELEAAREIAQDEEVSVDFVKADLRTFKSEKKFDLALNLYTSFGYCDTEAEDTQILKQIYDCLKPGGTFILECTSRESAIRFWTPGETFERGGKTVTTEFHVVGDWEGLSSRWTLTDPVTKAVTDHVFTQRLYSAPELKKRLLEMGYKSVEIYGGYDQRPYDENLSTMLLLCRK